jgi:chloramphenicol-sensitive protein RarD
MEAPSAAVPAATAEARRRNTGVIYALIAFSAWGFNPIYFKLVAEVPTIEVLAHRVLWALLLLALIVTGAGQWATVGRALFDRRVLPALLASTLLLAANWFVYIWAVANGHILETSIGYFINPLVNILLGTLFLHERLNRVQKIAVGLAILGTLNLALRSGQSLWISLFLALAFAFYGLVRKVVRVDALGGLFIETLLLSPLSLAYLLWLAFAGAGSFGRGLGLDLLLVASGPVTALPLLWFSIAARRLSLTAVGFFQYIAPSTQFLLAVFAYGEPFTPAHAVTFSLIWAALALLTGEAIARRKRRRLSQRS